MAFLILSLGLLIGLLVTPQTYFAKYLGAINPLFLFLVLLLLGILSLNYLSAFGFFIVTDRTWSGLRVGLLFSLFYFGVVILADIQWRFPPDINVPFPFSISFYPVIGYMVEVLFHLIPISLLLFVLKQTNLAGSNKNRQVMITFLLVILLEAFYQAYFSYLHDPEKIAIVVFVFLHLMAFTFAELWLFKKYGFITMYFFRICYYIFWHILWGHFRLGLLF